MSKRGLIPPKAYHETNTLEAEWRQLFATTWSFACLSFELAEGSYRAVKVGDVEVVLQLDRRGQPQAYANVCSHRHARLCELGAHNGPLRCPYHGWVYDREGLPVGIPQSQAFPHVVSDRQSYALRRFACEVVGQFVFVRLSSEGVPLREYLGEQELFLIQASAGMEGVLDEFRAEAAANWKIWVENTLEAYHLPLVHSKTFLQVESLRWGSYLPEPHTNDPLHSYLIHEMEPAWLDRFERALPATGVSSAWFPHFTNRLIFPNLVITSFMGLHYHVQRFEPTAADRTTVHSRNIGIRVDVPDEHARLVMERGRKEQNEFIRRVFDEDAGVCAAVQAGVRSASRPAVFGDRLEDRVAHFHRAYHAHLSV